MGRTEGRLNTGLQSIDDRVQHQWWGEGVCGEADQSLVCTRCLSSPFFIFPASRFSCHLLEALLLQSDDLHPLRSDCPCRAVSLLHRSASKVNSKHTASTAAHKKKGKGRERKEWRGLGPCRVTQRGRPLAERGCSLSVGRFVWNSDYQWWPPATAYLKYGTHGCLNKKWRRRRDIAS